MIEQLFEQAPCGYFCFADDGSLLILNETLAGVLHYNKEELKGKNVETIFTLPTRIFFQTHFFPLIKMHGHAEEIFISLLSSEGAHLPVLLNAKRAQWEGSTVTCCACILVPNRKKFEDELVAARKSAERALLENTELQTARAQLQQHTEKLEQQMRLVKNQNHELKQFSHVVTHNLKEPLRKIMMYTGRLQAETISPVMEKLVRSTEQMRSVVFGLQEYVWLNEKANQFSEVDLNMIIQKAVEQLKAEGLADLFNIQVDHLPMLEGDAEQLQLMIYHLLNNAVKFRKTGKANIQVQGAVIKQNKFRSVEDKYEYEDYVRLEVIDDGVGFDDIYREHIFELFRRLHFAEGQGLGLALCRKIADNHQGIIEAESKINLYTKITVWLPLRQSAPAKC